MPRLGVNVDHVATLRQARKITYPDPLLAAQLAEEAGADQIVCHLREDRRHIQDADLYQLRKILKIQLNLEMAATEEMVRIALDIKPNIVTLVPEKRQEITTEGGLDLSNCKDLLKSAIDRLQARQIPVSLFINPEEEDLHRSHQMGVRAVELHTGLYAEAGSSSEMEHEFQRLKKASQLGKKLNIKVFAGHGLHYKNVSCLLGLPEIEEYNIGHSIISRAIFVGMSQAVREMKQLLQAF